MQEEKIIKQRKAMFIVLALVFIGMVIYGIVSFIIDCQKTASVEILVAPSSAKIKIDHTFYSNQKTSSLFPGDYVATISADGFITKTVDLSFQKGETTKLYVILDAENGDENWYKNNIEEQHIVSTINDYYEALEQKEFLQKYPIIAILPLQIVEVDPTTYDWTEFRIDYGKFENCKTDFCLKITDSTGGNYDRALQEIRNHDFNPDDYEILYEYSPLTS